MTLKTADNPSMVTVLLPDGRRRGSFVEIGKSFYFDRFTATKLEKKEIPNPDGVKKDVSEMTVHDLLQKKEIVLVMNKPVPFPLASEAILEWRRNTTETIKAREGDQFRMPGGSDAPYRLVKVQEDSAVIAPVLPNGSLGKEVVIKKK